MGWVRVPFLAFGSGTKKVRFFPWFRVPEPITSRVGFGFIGFGLFPPGFWVFANFITTFRDLKEPLIPWIVTKNLLAIEKKGIRKISEKINLIKLQIQNPETGMSEPNLATLKYLLHHLLKVVEANNKMDIFNLGVVFGPTIMGHRDVTAETSLDIALDSIRQNTIVEILLRHFKDIFS